MGLYGNRRKKGYRDTSSYEQGAERYHSSFYHQYFEGYTEVKVASDHGKSKIVGGGQTPLNFYKLRTAESFRNLRCLTPIVMNSNN